MNKNDVTKIIGIVKRIDQSIKTIQVYNSKNSSNNIVITDIEDKITEIKGYTYKDDSNTIIIKNNDTLKTIFRELKTENGNISVFNGTSPVNNIKIELDEINKTLLDRLPNATEKIKVNSRILNKWFLWILMQALVLFLIFYFMPEEKSNKTSKIILVVIVVVINLIIKVVNHYINSLNMTTKNAMRKILRKVDMEYSSFLNGERKYNKYSDNEKVHLIKAISWGYLNPKSFQSGDKDPSFSKMKSNIIGNDNILFFDDDINPLTKSGFEFLPQKSHIGQILSSRAFSVLSMITIVVSFAIMIKGNFFSVPAKIQIVGNYNKKLKEYSNPLIEIDGESSLDIRNLDDLATIPNASITNYIVDDDYIKRDELSNELSSQLQNLSNEELKTLMQDIVNAME